MFQRFETCQRTIAENLAMAIWITLIIEGDTPNQPKKQKLFFVNIAKTPMADLIAFGSGGKWHFSKSAYVFTLIEQAEHFCWLLNVQKSHGFDNKGKIYA